jgi:hypothetical protein
MHRHFQPPKAVAAAPCALTAFVTVAAAWVIAASLSTNHDAHSRSSIEPVMATAHVSGPDRASTTTVNAANVTFEARWARATASMASADPTLARAADTSFESRWTDDVRLVPDDMAQRELTVAPVPTHFAKLVPAPAPASDNITPLPPKRALEWTQGVPLPRLESTPHEIARTPAGGPAPRVATARTTPSRERGATPQESHIKSMSLPGQGSRTAVYDISARTVYLPNGEKLEAHSGLGAKMDDPRYVNVRMRGPTPPNVYDLTLRKELFHGVRAIRLTPVDDGKMFGRTGMLAHTYMLGPSGQSNGCVSFRDYPKFLRAFLSGEVDRLVVVSNLGTEPSRAAHARRGRILRYALNNR